jgi:hypothetical protein
MPVLSPLCPCCGDDTETLHDDGEPGICDDCRAYPCDEHDEGKLCPRTGHKHPRVVRVDPPDTWAEKRGER